MQRVGVIVHPRRDLETPLGALREWTSGRGGQLVQLPVAGQDRVVAPAGQPADCEFIVALGGDGTALAALHAAATAGRPVLSAACGSLGALTSVVAEELPEALDRMVAGEWKARRLPALVLEGSGQPPLRALNDLVFIRGGAGQVSVSITVENQLFVRFGGDGLVVATPLGSSAYSVAAGGPLLASDGDGLVVTPLAPHGGFCPPLVAGPASRLDVEIEPGHGGARLEADGQPAALLERFERRPLTIRLMPEYATLAVLGRQEPLLAGLRRRRILMDSPRVLARDDRMSAGGAE